MGQTLPTYKQIKSICNGHLIIYYVYIFLLSEIYYIYSTYHMDLFYLQTIIILVVQNTNKILYSYLGNTEAIIRFLYVFFVDVIKIYYVLKYFAVSQQVLYFTIIGRYLILIY